MAGKASDYLENELIDHLVGNGSWSPPASYYIALSKADPTDDGSGLDEPTGDYARKSTAPGDWNTASSRSITNANDIVFAEATSDWAPVGDEITHFAIMDASTGGNMLFYGEFTASRTITTGDTFVIPSGSLEISVDSGGWSDYLSNELLDHVFGKSTFTPPSNLYVALSLADPTDDGSGLEYPVGDSYSHVSTSSADWDTASGGITYNANDITFTTATGNWGTITHAATFDEQLDADYAIQSIDGASKQFEVTGDQTAKLVAGEKIRVRGSTNNDGIYTVVSASYSGGSGTTTITVSETVNEEPTPTPTAPGWGYIDFLGNMLTHGTLAVSKTVNNGDTFKFPATYFSIGCD
ncbi:MAG: phage tail fiber protein [Candidatus Thorarchaeota archaeon]